jgi:hypothetical protein
LAALRIGRRGAVHRAADDDMRSDIKHMLQFIEHIPSRK